MSASGPLARDLGHLRQGRRPGGAAARRARLGPLLRRHRAHPRLVRDRTRGIRPRGARDAARGAALDPPLLLDRHGPAARVRARGGDRHRARAAQDVAPGLSVLAGKTLFNFFLFLAIAAVTVPGLSILLGWEVASPGALAVVLAASGYGLTSSRRSSRRSSRARARRTSSSSSSASRSSCRCSSPRSRRRVAAAGGELAATALRVHPRLRRRRHLRGVPAGRGGVGGLSGPR